MSTRYRDLPGAAEAPSSPSPPRASGARAAPEPAPVRASKSVERRQGGLVGCNRRIDFRCRRGDMGMTTRTRWALGECSHKNESRGANPSPPEVLQTACCRPVRVAAHPGTPCFSKKCVLETRASCNPPGRGGDPNASAGGTTSPPSEDGQHGARPARPRAPVRPVYDLRSICQSCGPAQLGQGGKDRTLGT